jgi:hypothetical protein
VKVLIFVSGLCSGDEVIRISEIEARVIDSKNSMLLFGYACVLYSEVK